MAFTAEQIKELNSKLNPKHVKKNPQGFDYVEGWHVIAEANRIFGFDGWNIDRLELTQLWAGDSSTKQPYECHYMGEVTVSVSVDSNPTALRRGVGYGMGYGKTPGAAAEVAIKGAATDALKRTLITFGWPFGLALYDDQQQHVGIEETPEMKNERVAQGLEAVLKGLTALQKDFGEEGEKAAVTVLERLGMDLRDYYAADDWPQEFLMPLEAKAHLDGVDWSHLVEALRSAYKDLRKTHR
ncbi:MAG: Rad52/Rad22 family DNA repair protein [Candidatus Altiarchaeota archaeon]